MYGEGAFNDPSVWTDENVKNWSLSCASMPNCNPTTFPAQGIASYLEVNWNPIKDAVKTIDPTRVPNPCNLLDTIFAIAKDLSRNQYGSPSFAGKSCFGIPLNSNSASSSSCNWTDSDYETAIRVWEFGTAYNETFTCATLLNSCATGGGASAACPNGDTCETKNNRYGSSVPSHNACLWDVAHGQ
jgi:hypothetical protein